MAREWTEEQKQAARERLAAARERKADIIARKQAMANEPEAVPEEQPEASDLDATEPGVSELMKMVMELKSELEAAKQSNPQTDLISALQALQAPTAPATNRMAGTVEKFNVNKDVYDDPREQLAQHPRLKRINFDLNYELDFKVETVRYQTSDNVWMKEPKFTLQLIQVVLDDDGEPTNRRIAKAQMVFFEDPDTAIVVAQQNGLAVDESNSAEFLNAMRFIRMRDWLLECFWPPKQDATRMNKTQMVIGGQVVETWEISSENNVGIPFDKLDSKYKA